MKTALVVFAAAFSFATVTATAADKPAKEHAAHAGKEHADKMKEKCAEMMEHNRAPDGAAADADKKGCGMMMDKHKGMQKGMHKGKDADAHGDHNK